MAGPRPLMSLSDNGRRDRMPKLPQHQGPVAAAVGTGGSVGFQTLQQHPHFSLAQHQRFEGLEEEEVGRMAGGGNLWAVVTHEQLQQRVLVPDALRQRRVNTIQPLATLANSLIHQGPGPGAQPADWDGGGLTRHIGPMSRGRVDRNSLLADEHIRSRQQQSVVNLSREAEFAREIARKVFVGELRRRESRDEILNDELVKSALRSHANLLDDARVEMSRAYPRPAAVVQQQQEQIPDPVVRNWRFCHEENGHTELIARFGDRSSSRNLERAHAAIGPVYQVENLSRKRKREEEADLDNRDRLIRHRRLSGIDSPTSLPVRSPPRFQLKAQVQRKERNNQEVQQHKAKYWQLHTQDEEHEEGQLTPPKPKQQGIEFKSKPLKQEQDVASAKGEVNVSVSRNQSGVAFPSSLDFRQRSRSRSPKARDNVISVSDESKLLNRSKEQAAPTPKRLPSPRYKNNERKMQGLERMAPGYESNSILTSDLLDKRTSKEASREQRNHTRVLNSTSAGRGILELPHHRKKEQQQQQLQVEDTLRRDVRAPKSRSSRSGGAEFERIRKEASGRTETFVKRKNSMTPTNDNRPVGEMIISVQKHGQRTVKVEDYKPRDTPSRVASQLTKDYRLPAHRWGSLREAPEWPFTVNSAGRVEAGVSKRKEYEGRPQATPQEKTSRSNSSKVSGGMHQQYLENSTLQGRLSPYFQLGNEDLIAPTDKYEPESHRTPSIFTRLAGLWPESDSPRTPPETKRKDVGQLTVQDMSSLQSSSGKFPNNSHTRGDAHESPDELPGFQISTRSRSAELSRESDDAGLMNLSRKTSGAERVYGKLAEPCERPIKASQKGQALDVSTRNESASKPKRESAASRLSHYSHKVVSASEQGQDGFHQDFRPAESPVFKTLEQAKSRQEEASLPTGNTVGTARLLSSDMAAADGGEQSPGNGLKAQPKVIATGHRKDQLSKKSHLNTEVVVQGSPLPVEAAIPADNSDQQKVEGKTSTLSAEGLPRLLGCRAENPSLPPKIEWFGSTISRGDDELASSQSDLGDIKPIFETVERELNPSQAVEIPSPVERVPVAVVLDLHSDGDTEIGLSGAPIPSSSLSTPKEVRLFGANLNAHKAERADVTPKVLEAVEGIDSASNALEAVDKYVVDNSTLPAKDRDLDSLSEEKIMESTASFQGSEKDICLPGPVEDTGDEQLPHLDKPLKAKQSVAIRKDALEYLKSTANDLPLVQGQLDELPSVPQEQHLAVPPSQNSTAAATVQGCQLSSSHATGPHTWHRGIPSSSTPSNNANIFRATNSFGGVSQSAGKSNGATQSNAYVRKGNSLVRAPGAANLPSANDIKPIFVVSGQGWPMARKLPMTKSVPFRNTFIANTATSKPYFSANRKYVAPVMENDGALASSARQVNPPKIPHNNNDLSKSQPSQAALIKNPPQVVPQLHPSSNLIAHLEQPTGGISFPGLPSLERSDDQIGEAGVCRTAKDTIPSSPSKGVTFVPDDSGTRAAKMPGIANRLYVRRKANQLVVAPAQIRNVLPVDTERIQPTTNGLMPGQYFKRKTNQLVRSISGKGISTRNVAQITIPDEQGGGSNLVSKKMRRGRVLRQKKGSPGRSSWVWTLNGSAVGHENNFSAGNRRTGPSLFPWKRQNSLRRPVRSQKHRPLPEVKKGSFLLLMSKRLRKVQPVQPVYTRSADGFSLHRSGVMSVGGGNLKWTKSIEKRAKQASEEVTKAVAEAEKKEREKKEAVVEAAAKVKEERRAVRKAARGDGERIVWVGLVRYKMDAALKTLQRIPDTPGESVHVDINSPKGWAMSSPLLTPRRSIIGGTVYLRVGNGNQLVRDPKAASRALANEKVRWSLHNARSRGAKKQQYCQFFTKFGKCNKESGKCPYIHDPEKVAVCTKFLKGSCTDAQCLLTHKVIPERMPDCSFFLEGLCTNENCPYRHVNVNPKAPYCEGFLRGYCKDGDKCNKKHTYVCSVYAGTGECPDRPTCKFHHPKKKDNSLVQVNGHKIGPKRKRRYFSTIEPESIRKKIDFTNNGESSMVIESGDTPDEGPMEFISLCNVESDEEQTVTSPSEPWPKQGVSFTPKEPGFAEEMEKWIKPLFLLQMSSSTAAAH